MRRLKLWPGAAFSLCILAASVHAQAQNNTNAQHGNQKKANVVCGTHSLQDAVDRAADGATITVQGTCTESVVIRKDRIRIVGEPGATVQAPEPGIVFTVHADGVEIRDLGIIGGTVGIDVFGGASAEIANNRILDYTQAGIEIRSNSNAVISGNYISSAAGAFTGINSIANSSAQLDKNTIENAGGHGINIAAASSAFLICGNTVSVSHPFFAGIFVSRTAQVGFAPGCANTIENSHPFGRAIFCSQTSSIFAGANQVLTGTVQKHPNCEVVALPGVFIP